MEGENVRIRLLEELLQLLLKMLMHLTFVPQMMESVGGGYLNFNIRGVCEVNMIISIRKSLHLLVMISSPVLCVSQMLQV